MPGGLADGRRSRTRREETDERCVVDSERRLAMTVTIGLIAVTVAVGRFGNL